MFLQLIVQNRGGDVLTVKEGTPPKGRLRLGKQVWEYPGVPYFLLLGRGPRCSSSCVQQAAPRAQPQLDRAPDLREEVL